MPQYLVAIHHPDNYNPSLDGEEMVRDIDVGPCLETKEHIGGFLILHAANMNEAVAWRRKAVVACRAPVEVRQFLAMPTE